MPCPPEGPTAQRPRTRWRIGAASRAGSSAAQQNGRNGKWFSLDKDKLFHIKCNLTEIGPESLIVPVFGWGHSVTYTLLLQERQPLCLFTSRRHPSKGQRINPADSLLGR